MWGNLANNLSNVVEAAKKQIDDLEQQLDAAVAEDTEGLSAEDLPDMDGLVVQQSQTQEQTQVEKKDESDMDDKRAGEVEGEEVPSEKTLKAHHGWNTLKQIAGTMTEEEAERVEAEEETKRNAQIEKLQKAHDMALKKAEKSHQQQLASLQAVLTTATKEAETSKAQLSEEQKRHREALVKEKEGVVDSITARFEKELAALSAAHAQTKQELDRLSTSHTERTHAHEADNARHGRGTPPPSTEARCCRTTLPRRGTGCAGQRPWRWTAPPRTRSAPFLAA